MPGTEEVVIEGLFLPDGVEHYHTRFGCIVCGNRAAGCTPGRCAYEHLERLSEDVLTQMMESTGQRFKALVTERIRRTYVRLQGGVEV